MDQKQEITKLQASIEAKGKPKDREFTSENFNEVTMDLIKLAFSTDINKILKVKLNKVKKYYEINAYRMDNEQKAIINAVYCKIKRIQDKHEKGN